MITSKLFVKKATPLPMPKHKNCAFNSKGYALYSETMHKIIILKEQQEDAYCNDYLNNKLLKGKNDYFLTLYLPLKRKLLHKILENHEVLIFPGEYRITNTFQSSDPISIKNDIITYKYYGFSSQLIKDIFAYLKIRGSVESLEFSIKPQKVNESLKMALSIFEKSFIKTREQDNSILIEASVLQIIALLLKYHPNNLDLTTESPLKLTKENHPSVKRAMDYIRDNFNKGISLEDIASAALLNKYYLLRLFKKETGETPLSYIIKYRVDKAKELLKQDLLKMEQIASAVGYEERHFRRIFKQITGYSPSLLRSK